MKPFSFAKDFGLPGRGPDMGGFGSGRPGWHMKAEHTRSLDVNSLHREGCLRTGYWGGWQWTRDGERVANIGLRSTAEGLQLTYRVRSGGDDWQEADYTVPLAWSPCTKGGSRPYFLCPGVRAGRHCGRRVAKLYSGGRYFLCRHCYRLVYQSQAETPYDRLLRRRDKLRLSMGGEAGSASLFPSRRKGQWRRTHDAQIRRLIDLEMEADDALVYWFGRKFPGLSIDDALR